MQAHQVSKTLRYTLIALGVILFAKAVAVAQGGGNTFSQSEPSRLLDTFKNASLGWTNSLLLYAKRLFTLLLLVEFGYSAITNYLQHQELQSWIAAMVRKILTLGAFYMLLVEGPVWIPAIIDSLQVIGQRVGAGALAPDTIVGHGFNITMELFTAARAHNWLANALLFVFLGIVGLIVLAAYILIAVQFIIAKVESYITVSAGVIFLGFGGSRWTSSYTERFIGGAVAVGIRLMMLYLIIALGDPLARSWENQANQIPNMPADEAFAATFSVCVGVVIFAMLCWTIPKLISSLITGSPGLSGADFAGMVGFGVGATVGTAALAAGVAATAATGGAAAPAAGAAAAGAGGGAVQSASTAAGIGATAVSSAGAAAPTAGSAAAVAPPMASGAGAGAGSSATSSATTASTTQGKAVAEPSLSGTSGSTQVSSGGKGAEGKGKGSTSVVPEIPPEPVVGPPTPPGSAAGGQEPPPTFKQKVASAAQKAEDVLNKTRHHVHQTTPPHDGGGGGAAPPSMNIGHHE